MFKKLLLTIGLLLAPAAANAQAVAFGNWTPVAAGSTSGGWVASVAAGKISQSNGIATVAFFFTAASASSPVGNITITGMPAISTASLSQCVVTNQVGLTNSASYTQFNGVVGAGTNVITITENGSGQANQAAAVARAAATFTVQGICTVFTQ